HRRLHLRFVLADSTGFRIGIVFIQQRRLERHLEDLGDVEGVASGALGDLLAATESVGNDEPVWRRLANGWEEFEFSDGLRDWVMLFVEAERSSHAAASRRWTREVDAKTSKERFFRGHLHERLVMAMPVEQSFARKLRERGSVGVVFEEFAEQ